MDAFVIMAKKKAWRKAVRSEMHKRALEMAQQRSGEKSPAYLYRWEHVQAVVTTAIKLAELTGADVDVVEAAAWLHDIRKDAGDKHPEKGAKFAKSFLPETDFPKEKIDAVASAVKLHMGLWRDKPLKNLEAQVLWDADKLTKIGVMAAFQWIGGSGFGKRTVTTESMIARLSSADFRAKTVASMHTKPAKRAAKQRFKAFDAMLAAFSAEWDCTDLKK